MLKIKLVTVNQFLRCEVTTILLKKYILLINKIYKDFDEQFLQNSSTKTLTHDATKLNIIKSDSNHESFVMVNDSSQNMVI